MLSLGLEQQSKVLRLIDRDDHSDQKVEELQKQEIFVTSRRAIENYLWDNELIEKLVKHHDKIKLLSDGCYCHQRNSQRREYPTWECKR